MIHPFEDAHIAALNLNADHQAIADKVVGTLRQLSAVGHAGTIIAGDGTVVGVYGAGSVDAAKLDEAEVFLFLNQRAAQRYAGTLVKDLRHELNRARAKYKTVNAISADEPLFFRWFHHLGFKFSGASARGGLAWTSALLLTFLVDRALTRWFAVPGVSLADPITAAIVITATAAVASTGVAVANYEASQSAARAQKDLRDQQAAQLQKEKDAETAQAAEQAVAGQSFGFSDQSHRTMLTGFGFGTAPSSSPNSGRAQITGQG